MEPVIVGKYQLIKKIASGGMAEIFVARATSGAPGYEKQVVIKRILPQLALNEEFLQMFLDEARVAATLQHPNIVQMYDIGTADGNYWITMEYLQGEDVRQILKALAKARKPLPLEHALNILIGASAGLHYAHEKAGFDGAALHIVHRDVNPQNIFVTWDGIVKVVDFGIAKAANRYNETYGGQLKGKIQYMSPEQCRSEKLDKRSDVYSLGILLYELTTGLRLYKGDSEFQVMKKIITEPPPLPSLVLKSYPKALEKVVLRALQKKPEDRHQTAQELQADLEQFSRDHKLPISTIALAQFMKDVFGDRIDESRDFKEVSGVMHTPSPAPPAAALPKPRATLPMPAVREHSMEDAPTLRVDTRRTQPMPVVAPSTARPVAKGTPRSTQSITAQNPLDETTEPSIVVTASMMVPMPTEDAPMARLAALVSTLPQPALVSPPVTPMPRPNPTPQAVAPSFGAGAPARKWPEKRPETEIVDPLPPPAPILPSAPPPRAVTVSRPLADRLEPELEDRRFRPSKRGVALAAGAGVLALAVVFWALSSRDETAPPPPEASASTAAASPSASPSPSPVAAPVPTPAPDPSPAPVADTAPGFAKITSKPFGASVFVDGVEWSDTTPTVVENLSPGTHDVKLTLDGHKDVSGSVTVQPNTLATLEVTLQKGRNPKPKPEPAAEPEAKKEPPPKREPKAEAKVDLKAERKPVAKAEPEPKAEPELKPAPDEDAGAEPERKKKEPKAGGTGEGELRVATTPSCELLVDGESKGFTPVSVRGLSAGKHTIKLVSEKFSIDKTVTVNVAAGGVTKKRFTFPVE